MKRMIFLARLLFGARVAVAAQQAPAERVDHSTGYRIITLSRGPGRSSSYLTPNESMPEGRTLVSASPTGLSAIDLQTRALRLYVLLPTANSTDESTRFHNRKNTIEWGMPADCFLVC